MLCSAAGRLRDGPLPDPGDYARGHARATGGSLVPEAYERFAAAVLAAP
jgi:hypothetical protein